MAGRPDRALSGQVCIRPARLSDTPAMLEITRNVWGGNDYVPFVWRRWLEDVSGAVIVAEENGRMVAFQHAALHPDGSAWLEGIRVSRQAEGRGIGQALLRRGIEWAREMGCNAVRLSTASQNAASNRMAENAGLRPVGRFLPVSAPGSQDEMGRGRLAVPAERDTIWAFLGGNDRFYTEGWTAYLLTLQRLGLLLATHAVAVVGDDTIEAAAIVTAEPERSEPRIGLAAGEPSGIGDLCRWLRAAAHRQGLSGVRGNVEVGGRALSAIEAAGFSTSFEWEMILYELKLT